MIKSYTETNYRPLTCIASNKFRFGLSWHLTHLRGGGSHKPNLHFPICSYECGKLLPQKQHVLKCCCKQEGNCPIDLQATNNYGLQTVSEIK